MRRTGIEPETVGSGVNMPGAGLSYAKILLLSRESDPNIVFLA
jgi:hypothetical protein